MTEIIKYNVQYVQCNGNDTTKHPEYLIYSLQNKYLGFITYSSKESIIFTEYKSNWQWFNVYPWPLPLLTSQIFSEQMQIEEKFQQKYNFHPLERLENPPDFLPAFPDKTWNWSCKESSNLYPLQLLTSHVFPEQMQQQIEKQMEKQMQKQYQRNFQQKFNQQMQKQNQKHFHQQIRPHMRFKLQQR